MVISLLHNYLTSSFNHHYTFSNFYLFNYFSLIIGKSRYINNFQRIKISMQNNWNILDETLDVLSPLLQTILVDKLLACPRKLLLSKIYRWFSNSSHRTFCNDCFKHHLKMFWDWNCSYFYPIKYIKLSQLQQNQFKYYNYYKWQLIQEDNLVKEGACWAMDFQWILWVFTKKTIAHFWSVANKFCSYGRFKTKSVQLTGI